MIIDAVLFNGEHDCMDIRRAELDSVIDHRIVVEGTRDFRGKPKVLRFRPRVGETYIVVDDLPDENADVSPWDRETHSRNAIMRGLKTARPGDLVSISDADEIPAASTLSTIGMSVRSPANGPIICTTQLYYYRLNLRVEHTTPYQPVVTTVQRLRNHSPQEERTTRVADHRITGAGWHFSYLGSIAEMQRKISQFAHAELDTPEFNREAWLQQCVDDRLDLFGRTFLLNPAGIHELPACIRDNPQRWERLMWKPKRAA